jgi:hypothetical protein
MARGLADLAATAELVPESGFVHGEKPSSIDAAIYGASSPTSIFTT